MIVDLKDYRCPNAQVALTRVLEAFEICSTNELTIITIEPSLERSLVHRIEHMSYSMLITQATSRDITDEIVTAWGVDVDEDDISDVDQQHTLVVTKQRTV
ncbi:hypothetical protein [Shewanella xiamenensis]|uniref:hypothetical protein n=1 Tax=Shewanella xiamenensis TaxID=332186 RepID=UPI001CC42E3A|nr:hypothetical protein [Shewanella xiamenensis]BDA63069.1 hypothetical protein NUITMVS1_45320 [Shewanella xiamenensis]